MPPQVQALQSDWMPWVPAPFSLVSLLPCLCTQISCKPLGVLPHSIQASTVDSVELLVRVERHRSDESKAFWLLARLQGYRILFCTCALLLLLVVGPAVLYLPFVVKQVEFTAAATSTAAKAAEEPGQRPKSQAPRWPSAVHTSSEANNADKAELELRARNLEHAVKLEYSRDAQGRHWRRLLLFCTTRMLRQGVGNALILVLSPGQVKRRAWKR